MKTGNNDVYVCRDKVNLGHNNAAGLVKKAVFMALEAEGIENSIVSCLLTDDEGIHELNKQFRDVDRVTDVLSFPMGETDMETGKEMLGDIMINLKRCEEQGNEFGHGFNKEIMYLTIHSVLHLLGYDHVDEGPMKKEMRAREKAIIGEE